MRARAAAAFLVAAAAALSGCFGPAENQRPTVHASASAADVAVGDEVIFTGTAVDLDGSVVRFEWDFTGDGAADFANATRGTAVFRFGAPGAYNAAFTATDDDGASASASVQVSVIARFKVTADWAADAGFRVSAPPTLDAGLVVVTATLSGAPAPFTYRSGQGLNPVDNGTYRVSLPLATLERYSVARVEVAYNGTPGGSRVFRAIPFFGAENDTSVRYHGTIRETRRLASVNTSLAYVGDLNQSTGGGNALFSFTGTGTTHSEAFEGGASSSADYSLTTVSWSQSVSTADGVFSTLDYAWQGGGTLVSTSADGLSTSLTISVFEGSRVRGYLTHLQAVGEGAYTGNGSFTSGTASYAAQGGELVDATDGDGVSRRALVVRENTTFNGTVGGAPYAETNLSERVQAASDALVNPDIFVSWNTTGRLGTTNFSDSGSRFLDAGDDGDFNPDPRPTLPSDGQFFTGLSPANLEEGDAFWVRNPQGATAMLEAKNPRAEVLVGEGFVTAAVDTVTVAGPVTGGGFTGAISIDVVGGGAHNHLRLRSEVTLALSTGTFSSTLALSGKGA